MDELPPRFWSQKQRDILGELRGSSCPLALQIECSLPKMKQPPGGRAERLLMSTSCTAIDRHDLRPNRTRRNRCKACIHTFFAGPLTAEARFVALSSTATWSPETGRLRSRPPVKRKPPTVPAPDCL